jgi:hypothetical protein
LKKAKNLKGKASGFLGKMKNKMPSIKKPKMPKAPEMPKVPDLDMPDVPKVPDSIAIPDVIPDVANLAESLIEGRPFSMDLGANLLEFDSDSRPMSIIQTSKDTMQGMSDADLINLANKVQIKVPE